MKKFLTACAAVLVVALSVVLGGAAGFGKKIAVTFIADGRTEIDSSYRLKAGLVFKTVFRYKNDYTALAEGEFAGDYCECLRNLNPELYAEIDGICEKIYVPAKNAEVEFFNGNFEYKEEENGRFLDKARVCKSVLENMAKKLTVAENSTEIYPEITVKELKRDTVKTAEFFTGFATSGENRRHNLALAAEKLNNTVVKAGETLSFNAVVGERTVENGFKEANIIKDGEFTPGVGGGVCQVSTTLFNCWLKAGLKFVSAAAHSLPVSYVKPSLDAMVSSATDLVLENDGECDVYIQAFTENNRLYFRLFGRPCGYEVRLRSEKIRAIEAEYAEEFEGIDDWQEGETERIVKKAVNGLISESYRDFYKDGVLFKTEKLRKNTYKAQKGIKIIKRESGVEDSESAA